MWFVVAYFICWLLLLVDLGVWLIVVGIPVGYC